MDQSLRVGTAVADRSVLTQLVLDQTTSKHGYSPSSVGLDRLTFARSYRPTWATVGAIILAPTIVGLFLLLVRRTESFSVSLEEDRSGLVVRIHGRVHRELLSRLRDAVVPGRPPSPDLTVDPQPVSGSVPVPHVAPGPDSLDRASSPWLLDAPTVGHVPADESTRVVRALPTRDALARDPSLRLDDGRHIGLERVVLVGRNPTGGTEFPDAELVIIDDDTISKTHAAFGCDAGVAWVVDRHSTNGTALVGPGGAESAVPPGQRLELQPGRTVRIGGRTLLVEVR